MRVSEVSSAIVVVAVIWGVVGLAFLVWYLWAMARLFPRIGLPAAHGWIPIWNQWRLLERAGLPGWPILLVFVPGVGIVPVVMLIIAMHRVGQEHGLGAGYTVLAVFIPPLWATMLGSVLAEPVPGPARRGGAVEPAGGYGGPGAPGAPGVPAGGGRGAPGAPAGRGGPGGLGGSAAPAAPAGQGLPPVPPQYLSQPGSGQRPVAQAPAQARAAQAPAQPAPFGQTPPQAPFAPPSSHSGWSSASNVDPAAQTAPPQGPPAAPASSAEPSDRGAPADPVAPVDPAAPAAPAAPVDPAAPRQPAAPGAPVQPGAQRPVIGRRADSGEDLPWNDLGLADLAPPKPRRRDGWDLGLTTEREYERLAAEDLQAPPSVSLAPTPPPRSFAWPTPGNGRDDVAPERGAETDDAAHAQREQPTTGRAMPGNAASAHAAHAEPAGPEPAAPPLHPAAVPPAAPGAHIRLDAAEPADDAEDDLDRTVVAARSTWNHWALVLPDDSRVELPASDIIIGRRPEARDGAVAVRIPDETRTLSKSHARMRFNGESWTIEDLGSTNGVALVLGDGREIELVPGEETDATARMIIGTLKVSLRDEGADR